MSQATRSLTLTSLIAIGVALIDQASKLYVIRHLSPGEYIQIIPGFFDLTLTFNKGAAFGLFASMPEGTRQLLLGISTAFALIAVGYFLFRDFLYDRVAQVALAFIFGGAIGNIIDRVRLGQVVDFIEVYYRSYHWPTFNIADSCICVGVAILFMRKPHRKPMPGQESDKVAPVEG